MQLRLFIIISAILLPIVAIGLTLYFSKGVGQTAAPNQAQPAAKGDDPAMASGMSSLPKTLPSLEMPLPSDVPSTLEEARGLAMARLEELKKLTQSQWNLERASIPYRNPPESIEDAVARAQRRVDDLMALTENDWPAERQLLIKREAMRNLAKQERDTNNEGLRQDAEKLFQDLELEETP